ncbi:ASCH domain-containing protein [Lentibacillus sediminis]|uniref:ASCH domain-containing protein n=1 Tax=Lentibacillus sediminis TaxID=1940529 RepID=UPI000C1C210B|nr:ASCH domain-containing protein [Lentibacillus sediminis]
MIHNMSLFEKPFNSIKLGRKVVEVRLNDEKRRKINVGDKIEFTKIPDQNETLTIEVKDLRKYDTFIDMYEDISSKDFDAVGESIKEMVKRTYEIYSPEQEKEWGTLAITINLEK